MGKKDDGKDSLAQQVEPETHWPELRILVLVVSQFVCVLKDRKWQNESEKIMQFFNVLSYLYSIVRVMYLIILIVY